MNLLGATFADDLHEAIEHAIRYAPEAYLKLLGISDGADLLNFFREAALTYPAPAGGLYPPHPALAAGAASSKHGERI